MARLPCFSSKIRSHRKPIITKGHTCAAVTEPAVDTGHRGNFTLTHVHEIFIRIWVQIDQMFNAVCSKHIFLLALFMVQICQESMDGYGFVWRNNNDDKIGFF